MREIDRNGRRGGKCGGSWDLTNSQFDAELASYLLSQDPQVTSQVERELNFRGWDLEDPSSGQYRLGGQSQGASSRGAASRSQEHEVVKTSRHMVWFLRRGLERYQDPAGFTPMGQIREQNPHLYRTAKATFIAIATNPKMRLAWKIQGNRLWIAATQGHSQAAQPVNRELLQTRVTRDNIGALTAQGLVGAHCYHGTRQGPAQEIVQYGLLPGFMLGSDRSDVHFATALPAG